MFKPLAQSLYVDLSPKPDEPAQPIHLGFRAGRNFLRRFLLELCAVGVNHVILNFKYAARNAREMLEEIGQDVVPQLASAKPEAQNIYAA